MTVALRCIWFISSARIRTFTQGLMKFCIIGYFPACSWACAHLFFITTRHASWHVGQQWSSSTPVLSLASLWMVPQLCLMFFSFASRACAHMQENSWLCKTTSSYRQLYSNFMGCYSAVNRLTACTNETVVSKFMLSRVPAAPLIHTWHCIHTCAFSRTAVDSRINQLNEELQTIKSQHKAEVNKLRKQLDEEKVKVKQMAAKVGLIWGGLIFEWFTSCMPLSCFSAVFFQIGTECWYKILVNVRCFEKKEKKSLTA